MLPIFKMHYKLFLLLIINYFITNIVYGQNQPVSICLQQIITNNKVDAENALAMIKAGNSFSDAVEKYSIAPSKDNNGYIGIINKGDLLPEIEKIAFNLKIDEISPIIELEGKYLILKRVDEKSYYAYKERDERIKKLIDNLQLASDEKEIYKLLQDNKDIITHEFVEFFNSYANQAGESGELNEGWVSVNIAKMSAEIIGDKIGYAYSILVGGNLSKYGGDTTQAKTYYESALKLMRENKDMEGEGIALSNLGSLYFSLNDIQKSLEYYNQSLAIRNKIGDKISIAQTLNNIGEIYRAINDTANALLHYNKCLSIMQEIKDRNGEALLLGKIGYIYYYNQKYSTAIKYLNQTLKIYQETANGLGIIETYNSLGNVYKKSGDTKNALVNFRLSIEHSESFRKSLKSQDEKNAFMNEYIDCYVDIVILLVEENKMDEAKSYMQLVDTRMIKSILSQKAKNITEPDVRKRLEDLLH